MIDDEYLKFLHSSRVSEATRTVLLQRLFADDPGYVPKVVSVDELLTLRAVLARVIPQDGKGIDLVARVDTMLLTGKGNGWRYAVLPVDRKAMKAGLKELDMLARVHAGAPFAEIGLEAQDTFLAGIAGELVTSDAVAMDRWFEEVRAWAVEIYMSHPATYARIGYSGIGDGGDSAAQKGFVLIGIGEVEDWEPEPRVSDGMGAE